MRRLLQPGLFREQRSEEGDDPVEKGAVLLLSGQGSLSLSDQLVDDRLRDVHEVPAEQTLVLGASGHFVQIEIGHALSAVGASRGSQNIYFC